MDMVAEAQEIARQDDARSASPGELVARAVGGEYLTFRLGNEEYAIEILRVQEIRSYEAPTRIANAPAHVRGVVNLRGVVVPIIDLRVTLGCEQAEHGSATAIVVLNVCEHVIGVVVDSVSDVIALGGSDIRPPPEMVGPEASASIVGIANLETGGSQRTLIVIDMAALLADASQAAAAQMPGPDTDEAGASV